MALIHEMNPLIRGWSTYFRTGVAKEVFVALDRFMYGRAQRYMQRRHPRKSQTPPDSYEITDSE